MKEDFEVVILAPQMDCRANRRCANASGFERDRQKCSGSAAGVSVDRFFFLRLLSVCGSTLNDGRTRAHVSSSVQCSSHALSTIPSCLGIGGHPTGSRQRTPTVHCGPISGKAVGGPNHSSAQRTVQIHPKHGSGALATRALATRVCCATADPETKKSMRRSTRTPKRRSATRSPVREGRSKRHRGACLDVERKQVHETHCETDEYFHPSISAEMLTIAVRTHADFAERTSMVSHSFSKHRRRQGR